MCGLAVVVTSVGDSREKLRLSVELAGFTSICDIVEHFGLGAVESPSEKSTSRSRDMPQSRLGGRFGGCRVVGWRKQRKASALRRTG